MSVVSKRNHPLAVGDASQSVEIGRRKLWSQKRAQQELTIVNKLLGIIVDNLNINEVFEDFVNELRKAVNVDWASIVLI